MGHSVTEKKVTKTRSLVNNHIALKTKLLNKKAN